MNANEIYERARDNPDDITCHLNLSGCYYDHFPDVHADIKYEMPEQYRIQERGVFYFDFDGRRIWSLSTFWLDREPFMITQNAGREGDDHARRFITDIPRYQSAVSYLNSLHIADIHPEDVIDPDVDMPELTRFYNHTLGDLFQRFDPLTRLGIEGSNCLARFAYHSCALCERRDNDRSD